MCEPSVYLVKNGQEHLLLDGVELIENRGEELEIRSLYGERKTVRAKVRSFSLIDHKILLEPAPERGLPPGLRPVDAHDRGEAPEPGRRSKGGKEMLKDFVKNIKWLGHDTFRVEGRKTLYFDPYQIAGGPKADLILISHDHFDHCSPEDVAKIQKPQTVICTDSESAKKLKGDVRVMAPGESITVEDIRVETVPSYNVDKDFHPKAKKWLGFIVEMEGIRIYHAGDTDFIPEMKNFRVDIALLPVSGTYVMTADQAVEAALAIRPKLAIPMHYGAIVGDERDAERFKKALAGKVEVTILKKA